MNDLFPKHGIRIDAGEPYGDCVAIRFDRFVYLFSESQDGGAPVSQLVDRVDTFRRLRGDAKRIECPLSAHALAFDSEADAAEFMRCWRCAARASTHAPLSSSRCQRERAEIPV